MLKAIYRARVALFLFAVFLFSAEATRAQIAPGVTQSAAHTATVTGTVTSSEGTPVADASVKVRGPAILTTQSDAHGTFAFVSVPWGIYQLTVTSALGTISRSNLAVNGDVTVAIAYQTQSGLRTIAQVSTHSAGASINVTPASIASITPSAYAFQGNASWQQLLNQVPGVVVGGGLRSAGGFSCAAAIPGGPFQPVILSINGALPYETSVTLDGMPIENSSPVNDLFDGGIPGGGTDVSFLPLATFDTADIVRGPGANAPSIVDSIGGSFVLHPPAGVNGDQYEFSMSNDPYGGIVSNAKVAVRLGRLSATLTYGVNDSPGPLGKTSIVIGAAYDPLTINGNPVVGGGFGGLTPLPGCCAFQTPKLYCCAPYSTAWTQHNGAVALSYNITPALTAQIFYAGSSSQSPDEPAPEIPTVFTPDSGYAGSIAPGTYNLIQLNASPIAMNKSESLLEEKITDYLGGGVLRFEALQNNSYYQIGSPNLFLPDGEYRVYGTMYYTASPSTPQNFNGTLANLVFYPYSYGAAFWTNNRDLLGSYGVQLGSRSHLDLSYVTSYYNAPSWALLYGSPYAGQSSAVSETTNEFHVGIGTELSNKLSLDGAWYFTRGSYHVLNPANPGTWTDSTFPYSAPRLSAVWRATSNVAIRAAAGGGYALPPLASLVGTNSVNLPCTTICSESVTNLNLKPEESFGFDFGTDMRFKRDTVLSFDLYQVNLYGQFYQSQTLSGTYLGLPLYVDQSENISQSRYEGITFDIHHDTPKGVYWHAALGLTRAYVMSVPAGFYDGTLPYTSTPCTNCANTNVVPGINFNGSFESPVPYANGTATIGYRWSAEKFIDFSPTYYGNGNPYFEPAFLEFDAHAGYALTKTVSLFATFRNITGIYDANYQVLAPTGAVPLIPGASSSTVPYPPFGSYFFAGIPYGPRSIVVTINFKS